MTLEQLFESTGISNIADIPKLLGFLQKKLKRDSILLNVSDVQPMNGPSALISGSKFDSTQSKIIVTKKILTAVSNIVTTNFTVESIQDMKSQYNENLEEMLGYYIGNYIIELIDTNFINKLKLEASIGTELVFNAADFKDWSSITNNILIKINREKFKLVKETKRPYKTWCIVTVNIANAILSNSQVGGHHTEVVENAKGITYLGHLAGMDYYLDLNYTPLGINHDYFIVGMYGNGIDGSSTIYAPYIHDFNWFENSNDGSQNLQVIDRSAWCFNPIDTNTNTNNNDSIFVRMSSIDLSGFDNA